jgi:hypothetical protein
MPTQGGSSERQYTWTWEAVFMLRPLLQIGNFKPVREALDFIFCLQDAGCPPEGKFTTTAIGTTGPHWCNTTGAALALAADYYHYAHDEDFLRAYLLKMLRAVDWIVGEIKATRKLRPDGVRPPTYGIMPYACASDGDNGYVIGFTDAYIYWGLAKTVQLLEKIHHARADELAKELKMYRSDLQAAIARITHPDGYIGRAIPVEGEPNTLYAKFETICMAPHLLYTGVMDMAQPSVPAFIYYMERERADGYLMGRMDRDVAYMGVGEFAWQDTYLKRHEWKKAFVMNRTNMNFGMTRDTLLVQERFSKTNPAFAPWQPNGSGNGRILEMIIKSFYFEDGDEVVLLGTVPFEWFIENGETALRHLHTTNGTLSIEVNKLDDNTCRLALTAHPNEALPLRIRFPDHLSVHCESGGVADDKKGGFTVTRNSDHLSFLLSPFDQ